MTTMRTATAVFVLMGLALAAPFAGADPARPKGCLVLAAATKRFEDLDNKVKALNDPEVSFDEARANTRQQVGLWRQMQDLLGEAAKNITDAPRLAAAVRENGDAIGQYADVVEEILPHTQENPPPADVRANYTAAGKRKNAAGRAMTEAAREICAK
ncbi:hypothetical protein Srot_2956 [Segniliparus rotundus DSM 44985]|uniref:Uncharacterized protein n=1 Tax=Segniliparus rotundus (strain ATCC BAA-972 / CDC 1076 / CIP 108378 / DSM 44985 / JCM 13578) TaxID=640132 RepID=D6ZDX8_SEGRD|nr:hypothetical protein [Segniliparus rotundus]ADG99385.1 hypothetical protein Srot_2956 [Segniliparus rotundus DSM 44985]